ncbi:MAG: alpha/beta fold hydrolase [Archangium sp.]|nr:alpha/beta fold hydrolase [Archangium sp.]
MLRFVILTLACAGCVAGNAAAGALLLPMRVPVVGDPGLAHDAFSVTTRDGIALDGWLFTPPQPPTAVLVFVHGKDINRQHFVAAAQRFVEQGIAVVAFDQRAHGRSTGEFVTYGAKEVGDLRLVIDVALKKWGRELPVVLVGESLGAAVALQTAAVDQRVRAVVAGAAFADLTTVIDDHAPAILGKAGKQKAIDVAEKAAEFHVADISPERSARKITVPTLLLHGSEDTYLPLRHSLRIYEALAGPRELVRLEGVDHIGILLSDEAWRQIDRFVGKALEQEATARHRRTEAPGSFTRR